MSEFSPYILFRRGTQSFIQLENFNAQPVWDLIEEFQHRLLVQQKVADDLGNKLFKVIPTLDDRNDRGEVISFRRRIHKLTTFNGVSDLPKSVASLSYIVKTFEEYLSISNKQTHLKQQISDEIQSWSTVSENSMKRLLQNSDLLSGIQLSGKYLFNNVKSLTSSTGHTRKKRKKIESHLLSYAYRSALKPSPFGTFTEVGATRFYNSDYSIENKEIRCSIVRVSRLLVKWIEAGFFNLNDYSDVLRVRLNNTVTRTNNNFLFVSNLDEEKRVALPGQQVRALQAGEITSLIYQYLKHHLFPPVSSLIKQIQQHTTLNHKRISQLIKILNEIGFIYIDSCISDQESDQLGEILVRLSATDDQEIRSVANDIKILRDAENIFSKADIETRKTLLESMDTAICSIARKTRQSLPSEEELKAPLFEDLVTNGNPKSWDANLLVSAQNDLETIIRIASVLDASVPRRLDLYSFFLEKYSGTSNRVHLLELFQAYYSSGRLEENPILKLGRGTNGNLLVEKRSEATDLVELIAKKADTGFIRSESKRLTDSLPVATSTTINLQISPTGEDKPELVLNGLNTGHGVFFSRFAGVIPQKNDGWSLSDAVHRYINKKNNIQCDLTAVLGLNFNIHPCLAPYEIEYPGSISQRSSLSLANIDVIPDYKTKFLTMINQFTNKPISFIPMNFLIPIGAPPLYQFLQLFSPSINFNFNLWNELYDAGKSVPFLGYRPRIQLNNIILERASWRFKAKDIPEINGLLQTNWEDLIAFDKWRNENGIPRHSFFLVQTEQDRKVLAGKVQLPMNDFSYFDHLRHASVHKPHYLDSQNPYLLRIFAQTVSSCPDAIVTFTECLPKTSIYSKNFQSAEEFFVEYNI